jgi:H+-translocating NAD(P) transhydrogenase subunit alpha
MIIGVLKEANNETRVSLLPEHIAAYLKLNVEVYVETDAGINAFASNEDYQNAGAKIASRVEILEKASIVLSISALAENEIAQASGKALIGFYQPLFNTSFIKSCTANNVTVFSIDMIPRTTRAQSMDVLSSQANIAGYKAVLLAANKYPKYFPMFMTAAGSIPPAKILILGAGVAGLQAIATAKRLGAVVEVFDTRPQVKEEVMSLGAKFIEVEGAADASKAGGYAVEQTEEFMQRQKNRIAESVAKSDIVITTAAIQGKKAPILITKEMITAMKKGSVIVDLAASTGGNTELTVDEKEIEFNSVHIIGASNLASTVPSDASKLYGKNILNFIQLIITKEGTIHLNFEDDLVKGSCITHGGEVINERVKALL